MEEAPSVASAADDEEVDSHTSRGEERRLRARDHDEPPASATTTWERASSTPQPGRQFVREPLRRREHDPCSQKSAEVISVVSSSSPNGTSPAAASTSSATPVTSAQGSSTTPPATTTPQSESKMMACVQAENEVLREACRRFEADLPAVSNSLGGTMPKLPGMLAAMNEPRTPSGLSTPSEHYPPPLQPRLVRLDLPKASKALHTAPQCGSIAAAELAETIGIG